MMGKTWLALRSVAMTLLFPGTVVGYLPYRILASRDVSWPVGWTWHHFLAIFVVVVGLAILLWCIWSFAHRGKGTLAPFDEPRKLVVQGLYRYVRNPMYIGVVLILLGEAWFFRSSSLLLYAGFFFGAANIFVMGYEERRLRTKFGAVYEHYCREVGRWIPGRPYRREP